MAHLGTERNPLRLRVRDKAHAMALIALCQERGWKAIVGIEPDKPEDTSDLDKKLHPPAPVWVDQKIGRNEPCPCGSGKKYKKCCAT